MNVPFVPSILACAAKEKACEKITPPGLPLPLEEQASFTTDDCIKRARAVDDLSKSPLT